MDKLDRYFVVTNKVVMITGATSGIGMAMSEAFADAGARLVIASDDAEACGQLAARLGERCDIISVPTDVRDPSALVELVDAAVERFGAIDVLLCNAGISGPVGTMGDADAESIEQTLAVNLHHPLRLATRVAPIMAANGGGSIILTSSIAALRGNGKLGIYGLSKAALAELARNLAVEWGPANVRANAIAPGLIRTSWADAILSSAEASEKRIAQTPLRRVGEPWEIAALALSLAGPGGSFITGQTIVADGGTLISDGS